MRFIAEKTNRKEYEKQTRPLYHTVVCIVVMFEELSGWFVAMWEYLEVNQKTISNHKFKNIMLYNLRD